MGEQGRHFERHPAVHAVRPVIDRPKQVGGPGDVLQRQLEEERLARFAFYLASRGWRRRRRAVLDGMVEDRRIGGQTGYRELGDVALERAVFSKSRVMLSSQRLWPRL